MNKVTRNALDFLKDYSELVLWSGVLALGLLGVFVSKNFGYLSVLIAVIGFFRQLKKDRPPSLDLQFKHENKGKKKALEPIFYPNQFLNRAEKEAEDFFPYDKKVSYGKFGPAMKPLKEPSADQIQEHFIEWIEYYLEVNRTFVLSFSLINSSKNKVANNVEVTVYFPENWEINEVPSFPFWPNYYNMMNPKSSNQEQLNESPQVEYKDVERADNSVTFHVSYVNPDKNPILEIPVKVSNQEREFVLNYDIAHKGFNEGELFINNCPKHSEDYDEIVSSYLKKFDQELSGYYPKIYGNEDLG